MSQSRAALDERALSTINTCINLPQSKTDTFTANLGFFKKIEESYGAFYQAWFKKKGALKVIQDANNSYGLEAQLTPRSKGQRLPFTIAVADLHTILDHATSNAAPDSPKKIENPVVSEQKTFSPRGLFTGRPQQLKEMNEYINNHLHDTDENSPVKKFLAEINVSISSNEQPILEVQKSDGMYFLIQSPADNNKAIKTPSLLQPIPLRTLWNEMPKQNLPSPLAEQTKKPPIARIRQESDASLATENINEIEESRLRSESLEDHSEVENSSQFDDMLDNDSKLEAEIAADLQKSPLYRKAQESDNKELTEQEKSKREAALAIWEIHYGENNNAAPANVRQNKKSVTFNEHALRSEMSDEDDYSWNTRERAENLFITSPKRERAQSLFFAPTRERAHAISNDKVEISQQAPTKIRINKI